MNPFLLCIPIEKQGVIEKLDVYQRDNFGVRFKRPNYLDEEPDITINASDYQEMEEIEADKTIREKPHHQERVD